jgi:hypothetical protein
LLPEGCTVKCARRSIGVLVTPLETNGYSGTYVYSTRRYDSYAYLETQLLDCPSCKP